MNHISHIKDLEPYIPNIPNIPNIINDIKHNNLYQINKGTSRIVFQFVNPKLSNLVIKKSINDNKQNIVESILFQYAHQTIQSNKIKPFLNPSFLLPYHSTQSINVNQFKFIISVKCNPITDTKYKIPNNIFNLQGNQSKNFFDYHNIKNWGIYQNKLKLIDYGFHANINILNQHKQFNEFLNIIKLNS